MVGTTTLGGATGGGWLPCGAVVRRLPRLSRSVRRLLGRRRRGLCSGRSGPRLTACRHSQHGQLALQRSDAVRQHRLGRHLGQRGRQGRVVDAFHVAEGDGRPPGCDICSWAGRGWKRQERDGGLVAVWRRLGAGWRPLSGGGFASVSTPPAAAATLPFAGVSGVVGGAAGRCRGSSASAGIGGRDWRCRESDVGGVHGAWHRTGHVHVHAPDDTPGSTTHTRSSWFRGQIVRPSSAQPGKARIEV